MNGFLLAFEHFGVITAAAKAVGIDRRTVNRALHHWPSFAACFADAKAAADEILQAEAYRRAVQGVEEAVWMKDANGNPVKVDTIRRYSDTLLMFLLRAANPDKYRESARPESAKPLPASNVVIMLPGNGREGPAPLLKVGSCNGNAEVPQLPENSDTNAQ